MLESVNNALTAISVLCFHHSGDILRNIGRGGDCIWTEWDWSYTSSYQCRTAWDKTESESVVLFTKDIIGAAKARPFVHLYLVTLNQAVAVSSHTFQGVTTCYTVNLNTYPTTVYNHMDAVIMFCSWDPDPSCILESDKIKFFALNWGPCLTLLLTVRDAFFWGERSLK